MAAVRVSRVQATSTATTPRPQVRVARIRTLDGLAAAAAVRVSRVVALNTPAGAGVSGASADVIYLRSNGVWVPVPVRVRVRGVFVNATSPGQAAGTYPSPTTYPSATTYPSTGG